MRIVSGILRGRIIQPPKNLRARPTTDFAKENLFNVIESHRDVEGADVLDLFAGTGSISYEFASRGAASVVSVEINARNFGLDRIHPVKANAFLYLKSCSKQFDLIFADPPYDIAGSDTIPGTVFGRRLLRPGGWLILEHSKNLDVSGFEHFVERRSYGSVRFSIFVQP